jgi:PAS domain S-box-containing protein
MMLPKAWTAAGRLTTLSVNGISNILDNLSSPAIIITSDEHIIAANILVPKISGYTNEEIFGLDLRILFPNLIGRYNSVATIYNLPDRSLSTILLTQKHERVPVTLHLHELAGVEPHYLITFEKIADTQRRLTETQRRLNMLNNIEQLFQSVSNVDSIEDILEIGSRLLMTNAISVYICGNESPIFCKTHNWGNSSLFPKEIPPSDLQHLLKTSLWHNGQRSVLTMLHQAIRTSENAYLATSPIGNSGAWTGFIASTGVDEPDEAYTLPILQILAEAVSLQLQSSIRISNYEQDLEASTSNLAIAETVQDNIQQGVILISSTFSVIKLNAAAEYMLGYASQEIQGQSVENVLIGTDRLLPAIRLALQGIPTHNLGKAMLHRRDGSSFPAILHTTPVQKKGEILGALIILVDISEHEQAQIRTQQLEQRALLGEVTAVFAHEVRNPINNISTGLQLMEMNIKEDDQENRELISRLQKDCNRLTDLMESILTFSRTGNYKFTPLDVESVIERLLTRWRPRMARLKIQHHVQVAPNTPQISGDQRALEQVFTNIISNAVRAMGETGGTLAVRIAPYEAPGKKIMTQIDISDTGPGIPDEIRDRIFDPFFTTDPNGTGLGLAITKQIITAHKGSISPDSFPGGTVFHIQIPALEADEELIL